MMKEKRILLPLVTFDVWNYGYVTYMVRCILYPFSPRVQRDERLTRDNTADYSDTSSVGVPRGMSVELHCISEEPDDEEGCDDSSEIFPPPTSSSSSSALARQTRNGTDTYDDMTENEFK
jgi:hypothetical protein